MLVWKFGRESLRFYFLKAEREGAGTQHGLMAFVFVVSMERHGTPFGKYNFKDWCRSEALVVGKEAALYATESEKGSSQHILDVEGIFEFSS